MVSTLSGCNVPQQREVCTNAQLVVQCAVQAVPLVLMAMLGGRILAFLYQSDYAAYASVSVLLFAAGAVRAITGWTWGR